MVELCAIRINDSFQPVGELHTLIKPPVPLSEKVIKIHNITNEMLKKEPTFPKVYRSLVELFLGCHTLVAHNAPFDVGVIQLELLRMDKLLQFPWPPIHFCTVEQSTHIKGHALKLAELYELATGEPEIKGAHRAKNDVLALIECFKWLKCRKGKK